LSQISLSRIERSVQHRGEIFAVALVRKAIEQARLSTICSARAEFADFAPRLAFVRMQNALQNASLFSCQRSLRPEQLDRSAPGGTFTTFVTRQSNKKPGVERRAKPSADKRTGSRDARLNCYPEFVFDLACDRPLETPNAPDSHSYSSDESRVYQKLVLRQAVLFKDVRIL
jgi:hypothetical protein